MNVRSGFFGSGGEDAAAVGCVCYRKTVVKGNHSNKGVPTLRMSAKVEGGRRKTLPERLWQRKRDEPLACRRQTAYPQRLPGRRRGLCRMERQSPQVRPASLGTAAAGPGTVVDSHQDHPYPAYRQDHPYPAYRQDHPYPAYRQDRPYPAYRQGRPYPAYHQDHPYQTYHQGRPYHQRAPFEIPCYVGIVLVGPPGLEQLEYGQEHPVVVSLSGLLHQLSLLGRRRRRRQRGHCRMGPQSRCLKRRLQLALWKLLMSSHSQTNPQSRCGSQRPPEQERVSGQAPGHERALRTSHHQTLRLTLVRVQGRVLVMDLRV